MDRNVVRAVQGLLGAALLCLLLASCATSKGATLGTVIAAQSQNNTVPPPQETQTPPPASLQGMEVDSNPDNAQVWIDGTYEGLTPVVISDIAVGMHRIVLHKDGYYESSAWIAYNAPATVYSVNLQQIVGFIQITTDPPGSVVTVGGQNVTQAVTTLPVGTYTVLVRAFGYTQHSEAAVVAANTLTSISITLSPAPFDVTAFGLPKSAINPENPGLLGTLDVNVSVTGPGSGTLQVTDAAGSTVFQQTLADFTTWDQSFSWNVHDTGGAVLPDGTYTLTLDAHGKGSDTSVVRQAVLTVDRSLKIAPRSVWSGTAGLLYAPVAEVLPAGDFQVSILGAGVAAGDPLLFQAPVLLGSRIGLGSSSELDVSLGVIVSSTATPVMGSVAARWNLASPHGSYGTALAVQAKLSAQVNPQPDNLQVLLTDTFADFTGVSVEVPFQLVLDRLNILLSAGATGSLWYPYRVDATGLPLQGAVGWLYVRGGAFLDLGSVTAGISVSTRTEPLPGGISLLSSPIPFEAGAELHWLIPGTRLLFSALAAGEYQDSQDYYFMGGAGLGFLY